MTEHLPEATLRPRSVAIIDAPPDVGGRHGEGSALLTDVLDAGLLALAGIELAERL